MRAAIWIATLACSGNATAPKPPTGESRTPEPPTVEVVVSSGSTLRWFSVSAAGARESRSLALTSYEPNHGKFVWVGREPALLLEKEQRAAVATARGLELVPFPPSSTWVVPKPENAMQNPPQFRLYARNGELWLARCEWTYSMLDCTEWINARIRPLPMITNTDAYSFERRSDTPKPPVKPSSSIRVELVPDTERPAPPDGSKRLKLSCTANGKTFEDPPPGEPAPEPHEYVRQPSYGRYDIVWLSTEPPIFQVGTDKCAPCPRYEIFEGCQQSKRFDSVELGPSDMMAFNTYADSTRKITFMWRGRELGAIADVDDFGFVPVR